MDKEHQAFRFHQNKTFGLLSAPNAEFWCSQYNWYSSSIHRDISISSLFLLSWFAICFLFFYFFVCRMCLQTTLIAYEGQ